MSYKHSLGYLIHQTASLLDSKADEILQKKFAVGLAQFRILLVLEERDGITQKKISEELSQSEASISRQIKIMSEKSLLETDKNIDSGREKLVYQTHLGHELAKEGISILDEFHEPLFEGFSEAEQQILVDKLSLILESLK